MGDQTVNKLQIALHHTLSILSARRLFGARGTLSVSGANAVLNTSYAPLSRSNGPFTIAFWFKSGNVNAGPGYLTEGYGGSTQWAVIYGFTPGQIEFYTGDPAIRLNTGIAISDTAWHHVVYRKSAAGNSSWDKFLDGVKTNISPSINFSLPAVSAFYTFNANNAQAPCLCSLADVAFYDSALPDSEIQSLAEGSRPPSLPEQSVLYWPLEGTSSPEPDASNSNVIVNSTLARGHPAMGHSISRFGSNREISTQRTAMFWKVTHAGLGCHAAATGTVQISFL